MVTGHTSVHNYKTRVKYRSSVNGAQGKSDPATIIGMWDQDQAIKIVRSFSSMVSPKTWSWPQARHGLVAQYPLPVTSYIINPLLRRLRCPVE